MAIADRPLHIGNKIYSVSTFSFIDSRYLHLVYRSNYFQSEFKKRIKGIIGGVSLMKFIQIPIPIPPKGIQTLIVEYMDKVHNVFEQLLKNNKYCYENCKNIAYRLSTNYANFDKIFLHQLSEYFDTLFTNEKSTKNLKDYILHLGVTGKLSSSSSNFEFVNPQTYEIEHKCHEYINEDWTNYFPSIPNHWKFYLFEDLLIFGPKNGYSPVETNYKTHTKSLKLSATTKGVFNGKESKFIEDVITLDSPLWLKKRGCTYSKS